MSIAALLDQLWRDYTSLTPQAARIHALLAARGETIRNDHVALRTFDALGLAALAAPFEALGWEARERYRFADKHLHARYWQHPDPALPKVVISELCIDELPADARVRIARLLAQIPADFAITPWAGRPWRVTRADYEALLEVSEYAAWMAAFGFHVNHFTVDAGALSTFAGLVELDAFLVASGFTLNDAGGMIKGTPAEGLEQSAPRADAIDVELADTRVSIPSCYYEFARRYAGFQGFLPASADKIFESTDAKRKSQS